MNTARLSLCEADGIYDIVDGMDSICVYGRGPPAAGGRHGHGHAWWSERVEPSTASRQISVPRVSSAIRREGASRFSNLNGSI